MMLMRFMISFLLFSGACMTAKAQVRSSGAFSLGWQNYSNEGLSAFQKDAPGLSEQALSSGGYGAWTFGHWMFGFKGAGFWGRERMRNPYRYTLSGGYFSLEGGYEMIQSDNNFLTVLGGVGMAGVIYTIENSGSPDLSNATLPVIYNGSYNWGGLMLDIGLRYERGLKGKADKPAMNTENSRPLIGLEAGYLWTPASDNWRTNGGAIIFNAPQYQLGSVYLRATFGGMSTYLKNK